MVNHYLLNVTYEEALQLVYSVNDSKTAEDIFKEISEENGCCPFEELEFVFRVKLPVPDNQIVLRKNKEKRVVISRNDQRNLKLILDEVLCCDIGQCELLVSRVKRDTTMPLYVSEVTPEDDLLLGASASPTTSEAAGPFTFNNEYVKGGRKPERRGGQNINLVIDAEGTIHNNTEALQGSSTYEPLTYVGLVNQAMTCYLNSLLQALYMTPEFRNALYNWEFRAGKNETQTRCIPYQLQKLFLNLQTSSKSAVETTDLTTSFGWQGSDAWHQHDIQELCRVMFDALEQKFKDTEQANLINDLYQGKMLDYVKCLECHTEKSREDTFLDIPLPVRPFGSQVAYNSVEEALRAFVQPETLDENNQYFCEKCNKKCDAHKGLKFTKFPYLLSLHLKRFDFDFSTMHRIKLNDKVVFPETLNLNSFIPAARLETSADQIIEERESAINVKCDDCSTTDSGSADDESCQGTDMSSTVNGPDDNCADSDEGIDVSSGINHENDAKGPYVYELFSIMIHSGSASGGHYYAYIKDFDKNNWYCFNDQSVSPITEDHIKNSYGTGSQRGYYSGVYTSSTNAYMLMYRQIDKKRNARAMTVEQFPDHIKKLLEQMRQKEEEDRLMRKKEDEMVKISVSCIHPTTGHTMDINIAAYRDSSLSEIAELARSRFKLDALVDLNDCRIAIYNKKFNCVDCSFEDEDVKLCEIITSYDMVFVDWFLEIKEPGTQWRQYKKGGINVKVYQIDLETRDIKEPRLIRLDVGETLGELKHDLGELLDEDLANLMVIFDNSFEEDLACLKNDEEIIKFDTHSYCIQDYKFFVTSAASADKDSDSYNKNWLLFTGLIKIGYQNITCLNVVLPDTDDSTLELLAIPSLTQPQHAEKQQHDLCRVAAERAETNSPNLRENSPLPGAVGGMCGDGYDSNPSQSNSEDSSLSDSDRTLIGDAPECVGVLSDTVPSPADQHMASPVEEPPAPPAGQDGTYNHAVMGQASYLMGAMGEEAPVDYGEDMSWDYTEGEDERGGGNGGQDSYFFKVTSIIPHNELISDIKGTRCCKILVDKRMHLETFKKHLELVLRVPSEYFKVYRYQRVMKDSVEFSDSIKSVKDGDMLSVKLEKVLKAGEHRCKVYHLKADVGNTNCYLFDHIITRDQTVSTVKKEVLRQAKRIHSLDLPYNKCRLRERSYKNKPTKVYLDDQRFGHEIDFVLPEFFLQELTEPETVTSDNQVVVFVRQWHPSSLTLEPFQEVVLDIVSQVELKTKIAVLSGIPLDRVEVARIKHNYPCDMHLLEIYDDLDWNPKGWNANQWRREVDDGCVFFYKDKEEDTKTLTPEERKEIQQKEDQRLCLPTVKPYSPSRERALKIYVDTSPTSKNDDSVD